MDPAPPIKGTDRNLHSQEVDYLRALCIGVVILMHFYLYAPHAFGLPPGFVFRLIRNGYYGVTGFFVISGYLITRTSLRRYGSLPAVSIRGFYWTRFCRIAPCLLGTVGCLVVLARLRVAGFNLPARHSPGTLVYYVLTFRANVYQLKNGMTILPWDIFWSLSVEECFYLLFPWLCRFVRTLWLLALLLTAVVLLGPMYRMQHDLYSYFSCFDQIALGILVAIAAETSRIKKHLQSGNLRRILLLGGMLGLAATYFGSSIDSNSVWGPSLIAISMAALLLGFSATGPGEALPAGEVRPPVRPRRCFHGLALIGGISYEIYLSHGIVLLYLVRHPPIRAMGEPGLSCFYLAVFLMLTIGTSALISRHMTAPLNAHLRRLGTAGGRLGEI